MLVAHEDRRGNPATGLGLNHARPAGVTLLELLCVVAIITVLAGLLLAPVSRILQRARAMKWGNEAPVLLESTLVQLRSRYQGRKNFPQVTLESLVTNGLLTPSLLGFLRDRRVTFRSFTSMHSDDFVVIEVRLPSGFLVESGQLTVTKGDIVRPPE
jgi:prepilin-type N-terminal cleavage/methylation domain-containing protein